MKPVHPRTRSVSELSRKLRAYRRSLQVGAVAALSMTTVRALSVVEQRDKRQIARLVESIVATGKTDSETQDAETLGAVSRIELATENAPRGHALIAAYALSVAERNRLAADLGRAPRSLVLRAAPIADVDEPLPSDFTPAPVADYSPILLNDPDLDAQAAREAAEEIAQIEAEDARQAVIARRNRDAVAFRSDYADNPRDYAPIVRHVNRVAVQSNAAAPRDPVSEHAALLAAVLGRAKPRKPTFRV